MTFYVNRKIKQTFRVAKETRAHNGEYNFEGRKQEKKIRQKRN